MKAVRVTRSTPVTYSSHCQRWTPTDRQPGHGRDPALRGIDEGAIDVLDIALAVIAWSETRERQADGRTAMMCKFDECL